MEWAFHLLKRLGEITTHSPSRNISTLLCSWAGMWNHCVHCSVSLLQSCPLHREPPHLFRLNSCLHLPWADFREGQWWAQQVGRYECLLLGSLWDVARIWNHCHFIIYRHVCIVSGAQLLSGVRLFAILWIVAHQAPLPVEFSRQEYWSGLLFSPPGDLPEPGIEPSSPQLAGRFFTAELLGKTNL